MASIVPMLTMVRCRSGPLTRTERPECFALRKDGSYYRPELDVLRCFAFLLVFLHHSALFQKGPLLQLRIASGFGLPLFFFLSAFLITDLLDREKQATGTVHLGAFYIRRILRIWPLYFAVLLLDFVYMHFKHPGVFSVGHLLAFALLGGNWFVARHGWIGPLSIPLWSISIEEQFYLLWPSVHRLADRRAAILCAIAAFLGSYLAMFVLCRQGINLEISFWVNSLVQFQFFASGALLSLSLRYRIPRLRLWQRGLLFAAGVAAFYSAQAVFEAKAGMTSARFSLVGPGYLVVNAGCVAFFLSFLGTTQLAGARALIYLGKISFGLYVFHFAMLNIWGNVLGRLAPGLQQASGFAFRAVFSLASTILMAAASYRYFEKPLLRFKQRFEVIRTRPV